MDSGRQCRYSTTLVSRLLCLFMHTDCMSQCLRNTWFSTIVHTNKKKQKRLKSSAARSRSPHVFPAGSQSAEVRQEGTRCSAAIGRETGGGGGGG